MIPWAVVYQAPCPWSYPDTNTGVGSHSLLQRISLTWGSNPESESEVAQSCPTLCGPMDGSPPDSSAHGDSLAKNYWSGLPRPPPGDPPDPGIELLGSCISGGIFTIWATRQATKYVYTQSLPFCCLFFTSDVLGFLLILFLFNLKNFLSQYI